MGYEEKTPRKLPLPGGSFGVGVHSILAFAKGSIAQLARESKRNLFPRKRPLPGGSFGVRCDHDSGFRQG